MGWAMCKARGLLCRPMSPCSAQRCHAGLLLVQAKAAYAQPNGYRVSDEVDLALDIQELKDGSWQPYT